MSDLSWTVIKPEPSIWPITPSAFWKWKEAFYRLILREFQVRFRDTYLGYIWILLQPVLMLGLILVFLRNVDVGVISVSYHLYVLSGLIFWFFISNSFTQGSISMIENRSLVVQTNLKRVFIPSSIVFSRLFDLFVGLVFLAIWIAIDKKEDFHAFNMFLIFDVTGLLLLTLGLTMASSAICVQFKDVRYIVPFLAQLLFFASPLFYVYPEHLRDWAMIANPFSIFLLSTRDHLFGTNYVSSAQYFFGYGAATFVFLVGAIIFRKFERTFSDVI